MHTIGGFLGLMSSLALGGFDPAPALIAGVFLAAGAHSAASFSTRRHHVLLFATALIGGTALWGVVLALTVGSQIAAVDFGGIIHAALNAGWWTILGKALIAIVVAGVGWNYWRRKKKAKNPASGEVDARAAVEQAEKDKTKKQTKGLRGLMLTALFFVAIVTTDVPFLAGAIAAGSQPLWANVVGNLLWAIISQLPLVVLCVALAFGRAQAFSEWLQRWWDKVKRWFHGIIPTACALISLSIIIDILLHVLWLGLGGW